MTTTYILGGSIGIVLLAMALFGTAATAEPIDDCVSGDDYCVCVSDTSRSCEDTSSQQDDCQVHYRLTGSSNNGFWCEDDIIGDLPGGGDEDGSDAGAPDNGPA